MKRILVHINVAESGEYDIFKKPNIEQLKKYVREHDNQCPNWGNKLWFQGLISVIESEGSRIDYYEYNMSKDYINDNYDLIVAPMANVFSVHYKDLLESLTQKFEGIKIPVYVVACGVQADSYDDLDMLCDVLREPATKFIKSVYNTGGEFALRGYFTKEFFEKLGFRSAVVTGCPSMYQLGENLQVNKLDIGRQELKPMLNGEITKYAKLCVDFPNAEFFDQQAFYRQLYDEEYFTNREIKEIIQNLIKVYGLETVKWLSDERIKLFFDMNLWQQYICWNEFNLSFGNRIHGSIMPVLSGVPAVLNACDSRTREMAEFFEMPCILGNDYQKYHDLYEIYEWMDYSSFNRNFKKKFEAYEKFLRDVGIVEKVNQNNRFFYPIQCEQYDLTNESELHEMKKILQKNSCYYKNYDRMLKMVRKLRGNF